MGQCLYGVIVHEQLFGSLFRFQNLYYLRIQKHDLGTLNVLIITALQWQLEKRETLSLRTLKRAKLKHLMNFCNIYLQRKVESTWCHTFSLCKLKCNNSYVFILFRFSSQNVIAFLPWFARHTFFIICKVFNSVLGLIMLCRYHQRLLDVWIISTILMLQTT